MSDDSFFDEKLLLEKLREGDKGSFEFIFDTYWTVLYKSAYRKLKSRDDAEEMVQTVFVELWEKRNEFVVKNLSGYLHLSLRNKVIDHIRKQVVRNKYADYCKSFHASMHERNLEEVMYNDLSDLFKKGLERLPEKSKTVFILSRIEGLRLSMIANRIKLSEKAVQYHLTKSLKLLKIYLKDYILLVLLFPNH